jgi:hypothetical protein
MLITGIFRKLNTRAIKFTRSRDLVQDLASPANKPLRVDTAPPQSDSLKKMPGTGMMAFSIPFSESLSSQ